MWNVYVASSWTFFQSRWRAGVAGLVIDVEARDEDLEAEARDESSLGVGARTTIFLDWRLLRGRDGSLKGGLRTPTLGVIMNF